MFYHAILVMVPSSDESVQILIVQEPLSVGNMGIPTLLSVDNGSYFNASNFLGTDLSQAPELLWIIQFLLHGYPSDDQVQARKVVVLAHDFDNILFR